MPQPPPFTPSALLPEVACHCAHLGEGIREWEAAALPWTTEAEQERARRFLHPVDAARHLVGRAMARALLGLGGPVPFDTSPWGKPLCPGNDIAFSISHSGPVVWVALCRDAEVGIDVEASGPPPDARALAMHLHPGERAEISQLPDPEAGAAFLRCWTRKEATLKALGEGLQGSLTGFRVATDARVTDWLLDLEGWTTVDLPGGGHQVSVAARAPGLRTACSAFERSALRPCPTSPG